MILMMEKIRLLLDPYLLILIGFFELIEGYFDLNVIQKCEAFEFWMHSQPILIELGLLSLC